MEEVGVSMIFSFPFLLCCLLSLLGYGSEGFLSTEDLAKAVKEDMVLRVFAATDVDLVEVSVIPIKVKTRRGYNGTS